MNRFDEIIARLNIISRFLYHGVTKEELTGEIKVPLFLAYDKELARAYSETGEILIFENLSENPLILDTPEKFIEAWESSDASLEERFHPQATHKFAEWAKSKGYDAVNIPESAFEGELGYEWVAGTFGEPQVIILDKNKVKIIDIIHED